MLYIFLYVSECTRIPLRWSAPESILYDKYSKESDVYMVGQLLYELFTHGCHPYTELYGYSLDYVLELVRYTHVLVSLICFLSNKARMNLCIPLLYNRNHCCRHNFQNQEPF